MNRFQAAIVAVALVALLFTGCAQTTVIREPDRTHRVRGARADARPMQAPKPGSVATVRAGETLYRIATEHGISPLDLAMWNRIPPPYTIFPGQRLRLTAPADARAATTTTAPSTAAPSTSAPSNASAAGGNAPAVGATSPAKGPNAGASTTNTATPATPPQPAFDWRWPADGNIVERYAAGDPTKQGIDIAGKSGSPVRAAADGVVVYSGAGLVGYGELIIIKHSEQWLTAYGHNRARLVDEGQRVKAGEQIAEMGHSGTARDMLHFEIRYNGKPQDPLQALPKR